MVLLLTSLTAQAQQIVYVYDGLGRLVAVTDQQGRTAIYEYDSVGNVLAIRRQDAVGPIAISFVSPNIAMVGAPVQILGVGFSTNPTDNQVAFNGVPAQVLSSGLNKITTTVPAGATTGPISVATALGTATSPHPFTVIGSFAVVPNQVALSVGSGFAFQATLDGVPTSAVIWRVVPIRLAQPSFSCSESLPGRV